MNYCLGDILSVKRLATEETRAAEIHEENHEQEVRVRDMAANSRCENDQGESYRLVKIMHRESV